MFQITLNSTEAVTTWSREVGGVRGMGRGLDDLGESKVE